MADDIGFANKSWRLVALCGASVLTACTTSSHVLLGETRPAGSPSDVTIYLEPVRRPYAKIALVDASSSHSWVWSAAGKADVVLARLKVEAAKLGANGILLEEITDGPDAAAGAGVAPDITRDHASIGVGFDAVGLFGARHGRGVAIYVAPDDDSR
jgi:hypothetical protein